MIDQTLVSDIEKNQHESAIERLCEEYPDQCRTIRTNYEKELEEMLEDATIRSYLSTSLLRAPR